ncbi:isoprenyl transferase [Pelobacter propionicus]|uniref:Isoprenyl transferase n=1 Tax=Pelobacter propionicus (strain DSM 2379 / NBRC 103807 / OttBd1) TaxID=338966 RepID=A1AQN6_PELPD|nr:isoprenyl transferase [Pelobacter propionicus]ABK99656.1 Undecaprenyl pyrophosphate synthetase [Pelobacter propionicus DSM 2379]
MRELDPERLPVHLAIIMDGNGRWAQQRMLKRIVGHQRGAETVNMVVEHAWRLGIQYLTLFAFSSENWSRPAIEVRALMSLLKKYIRKETARMMRKNIRYNVIGNRSDLPVDVNETLDEAIKQTSVNTGMTLTLALSYGGRQELSMAARRLACDVRDGKITPDDISVENFGTYLDTGGLPDPDFLIRTSGEMRISNFLLWQLAYTELYFTETNWPDFTINEFNKALIDFQSRERRFGKTSDQISPRNKPSNA